MFGTSKSKLKNSFEAGGPLREASSATERDQAGIWITLVAALLAVSALDHFTKLPWYATYPIAVVAGLLATAAYLQIKSLIFGKK